MSFPARRYSEDPTGRSPNNLVASEIHTVGPMPGPYFPIAPNYGPFFNDRETLLVLKNGIPMEYETSYRCMNLVLDATSKFSGPVCELLILQDVVEGDSISISYQCLGGLYQNHAKGLADLYQAWLLDGRPVDWTRIRNKPNAYPPAYHLHMLSDVIGWQTMVVAIERLINALTLRSVPAFEALIDWVMARSYEVATEEEIRNIEKIDRLISLRRLVFAAETMNFNAITVTPSKRVLKNGDYFRINVRSTNFPRREKLFWSLEHESTAPGDFQVLAGEFIVQDQEGGFYVPTRSLVRSGERKFRVVLRRNGPTGPILASSPALTIIYTWEWSMDYGQLQNGLWALPTTTDSVLVGTSPEGTFLIPDNYFYQNSNA